MNLICETEKSNDEIYLRHAHSEDIGILWLLQMEYDESLGTKTLNAGDGCG